MNERDRRHADERSTPARPNVEENLFNFLVELEVEKATRLQYCVSVVCLTPDLPHGEADPGVSTQVAQVAAHQLRATDVVATLSHSAIALLLVDAETATLSRIVRRATEALESRPLKVGGREARVTWSAGAGCYPFTANSGRDLLRQAAELMERAREEGGRRCYVAP